MGQKPQNNETKVDNDFIPEIAEGDAGFGGDFNIEGDFDAESEYKPTPLIPQGNYHANVTEVKLDTENQAIIWVFTLVDNGGFMTDNETAVDGVTIQYKNWLPRLGDENELTTSGKQTKRQAKINMLNDFGKAMKINVSTPKAIVSALQNSEWIGLSVMLTVGMRTYQGRVFNDVTRVIGS
jgi:hypothetical protein